MHVTLKLKFPSKSSPSHTEHSPRGCVPTSPNPSRVIPRHESSKLVVIAGICHLHSKMKKHTVYTTTCISDNKIPTVATAGEAHMRADPSITIATCFATSQRAYFRLCLRLLAASLDGNGSECASHEQFPCRIQRHSSHSLSQSFVP